MSPFRRPPGGDALRPTGADVRHVLGLVGRVLLGIAALHLPALALSVALGEWDSASAMAVGASLAALAGILLRRRTDAAGELAWAEGVVTVALSWLLAPVPVAVSFHLAGPAGSPLDGYFDALSGLTTSGLSVLQDIDHASAGIQLLRHLLHFAGGQGIVVVVLMLAAVGGPHVGTLLASEGREQRLTPNAVRTAKLVYLIAAAWGLVGTFALFAVLVGTVGLAPGRGLLHAVSLFMAAFDTGGFSIQSTSIAYYHSALLEAVLIVLMIAGALSFPLHYRLWRRRIRQAGEDLDLRTLVVTTTVLVTGALVGLAAHGTFDSTAALVRKGAFTIVSAATGTGFAVVSGWAYEGWGQLAPGLVVIAMALGAMAGSTAGGIKAIRVGLVTKAVLRDVRAALGPPSAVVLATYHDRRRRIVDTTQVARAVVIAALFMGSYIGGALVFVAFTEASFEAALFESTSATATVGLSVGITSPTAPLAVKLVTIAQMWVGRLEFLASIALGMWVLSIAGGLGSRLRDRRRLLSAH